MFGSQVTELLISTMIHFTLLPNTIFLYIVFKLKSLVQNENQLIFTPHLLSLLLPPWLTKARPTLTLLHSQLM